MSLKIWGCKDIKMQVSTHEHKDIRMPDARIQASAQEPIDVRMQGHKQVKYTKHAGYF